MWPKRKILARVSKGDLGWVFNVKATSKEDAAAKAIDRTRKDRPDILECKGILTIEFFMER